MDIKEFYNLESKLSLSQDTMDTFKDVSNSFFKLNHSQQKDWLKFIDSVLKRIPTTNVPIIKEDFVPSPFTGYIEHKMYDRYMSCAYNFKVFNSSAYGFIVRREYEEQTNSEIENTGSWNCDSVFTLGNDNNGVTVTRLYISKGGIVTGDYIDYCYLKEDVIKYIESIKIPISVINTTPEKGFICFVVDHREPKLKELMNIYDCKIKHDDNIKFNIRNFIKLKSLNG